GAASRAACCWHSWWGHGWHWPPTERVTAGGGLSPGAPMSAVTAGLGT
ncbi:Synaptophysin-like protein 2, partial [Anas platyrhynchos]